MRRTFFQLVRRDGHPRVIPVCRACGERLVVREAWSQERWRYRMVIRCGCDRRAA